MYDAPTDKAPHTACRHRQGDAPHQARPGRHRHEACIWLDRCLRTRCEASWRNLLGRYGGRIRRLIYNLGRDHGLYPSRAEAAELAQDLYLGWLRRGTLFRGRTFPQFWSFVATSVRCLVIDEVRRLRADKRSPTPHGWHHLAPIDGSRPSGDEPTAGNVTATAAGTVTLQSAWTPEDRMLATESYAAYQERLLAACREVMDTEEQVEILAAILLDGYSSVEVSRALARRGRRVCASTLDSWVHRLRRHLGTEGLGLPHRRAEPEGVWAPKLPLVAGAERAVRPRGPGRRCTLVSRPGGVHGDSMGVCTMGRS